MPTVFLGNKECYKLQIIYTQRNKYQLNRADNGVPTATAGLWVCNVGKRNTAGIDVQRYKISTEKRKDEH